MSRLLHFRYETRLSFDSPVTGHTFVLRCLPPEFPGQQILDAALTLEPAAPFAWQRASFGNLLAIGRIDAPHTQFCYTARGTARVDLAARRAERCWPVFRLPSGYTQPSPEMAAWLQTLALPGAPRERAWALAQAVHRKLTYVPGATGVATTARQAFTAGRGVCQDFAHIYLALARLAGLAARYVSGLPEGEGASHAWCEVWLDGIWTGIDPTRMKWADEDYLRLGAGRDFGDCPVERGVFVGAASQQQTVFMRVTAQA